MLVIFWDQELKFVIPIKTLRFKSFFIVSGRIEPSARCQDQIFL